MLTNGRKYCIIFTIIGTSVLIFYIATKGGFVAMCTEALKSRICELQHNLDRITAIRNDITSDDILKMSKELDDLIVKYTKMLSMVK
jgi:hypothetical protein